MQKHPRQTSPRVYLTCYTKRFWNELETPGPRVPITKNDDLFRKAAKLGQTLIWLHTYGERFQQDNSVTGIPSGTAKAIKGVTNDPAKYPEAFEYDLIAKEIRVGDGRFGPVSPEVWDFEVSGLKVVQSWLAYRMKARAGKKSSPLDVIRPERWTSRMTDELLELLWVLEATLALEPDLSGTLDAIVKDQCFTASVLPQPVEGERQPLKAMGEDGELLAMMEAEATDEDEEMEEI
jgi:Type ISP C-terminal specificity domain